MGDGTQLGDPAGVKHGKPAMDIGGNQYRTAVGYIELFCRSATQKLKLRFGHDASPPTRHSPSPSMIIFWRHRYKANSPRFDGMVTFVDSPPRPAR